MSHREPTSSLQSKYSHWLETSPGRDVFDFLAEITLPSIDDVAEILLMDQVHSWNTGQGRTIEEYLAKCPPLGSRPDLLVKLVREDLERRGQQGESIQLSDYVDRWPVLKSHLPSGEGSGGSAQAATAPANIEQTVNDLSANESAGEPVAQGLPKLGRFQLKSVLGEGSFGTVYRAYDPQLDRDVAVKVPRKSALQSDDDRARFLREARAAGGLHHAQICPVYEVGTIGGQDYIVMAFIDGKPLSKVLKSATKLTDRQIASVIRRIALGLEEAHAKGVIHRDLKPANIMISSKGEPVIMDFGLARRSASGDVELSQSGMIIGTPAYMSPEQARGDSKTVGPAADIYSLGVILYEMICGRRPFEGTLTEVIGEILHIDPEPPSKRCAGVSPQLEEICLKSIAKRPADRFQSMKEFAAALGGFVKSGALQSPRIPATTERPLDAESLQTERLAKLMAAVSSNIEEKVEQAAARAVEKSTGQLKLNIHWSSYLIGAVLVALSVFLGLMLAPRGPTTIIVQVPLPEGIDLKDLTLTFALDGKSISADELGKPIQLKEGPHELVVYRSGNVIQRMKFDVVLRGLSPGLHVKEFEFPVPDVTPLPDTINDLRSESSVLIGEPGENLPDWRLPQGTPKPATEPFSADQALKIQASWAKYFGVPVEIQNSIGMKFRLIPPGDFPVGLTREQLDEALEKMTDEWSRGNIKQIGERRMARLLRPVYFCITEVTFTQFKQFVDETKYVTTAEEKEVEGMYINRNWERKISVKLNWRSPHDQIPDPKEPVTQLSVRDMNRFMRWLTSKDSIEYRLPTESEWEYAARAGVSNKGFFVADQKKILDQEWLGETPVDPVRYPFALPVGMRRPNQFGLYDCLGNVKETCVADPPLHTGRRNPAYVIKGCCFIDSHQYVNTVFGFDNGLDFANGNTDGFRVVRDVNPVPRTETRGERK